MKADSVLPAVSLRPRLRLVRVLSFFIAVVVLIVGGLLLWFLSIGRSALPQIDGTVAVTGLSAPVSVTRDGRGVPTINATTIDDLFFAQGYVTAQDRLFQMDLLRRAARGELAEIVGEIALKHDRQQRILSIRATAEKGFQSASAEDKQQFAAYARGVNAYIESHRDRLPLEFRILRYAPRPWTEEDSLAIAYQMIETLSISPKAALTREKVLAKLGPELTADLYVNTSWRDHPPVPALGIPRAPKESRPAIEHSRQTSGAVAGAVPIPELLRPWLEDFLRDEPAPLGSNNWVISGDHTTTGKPLLSNDMHLGHQMPNLWYAAHLRSRDFDVAGVTLPGYPYVIVGHNRRIAWGCTNVGPTVEDAYIENFNAQGQYLTPDGWKSPEVRHEIIHVKGKPDVALDVEITRHGPIVTELSPGETRRIALRWTLYDGTRNPFFRVDSAQNWQQFRQAFSEFDAPGQNVVYADVDGNIGYQTTGRIPIRAAGDGSLPVDGSNNAHEWTGYIPFEKLPSVLNPASGIIGTANGRITPDGYPYSLSVEWEAPWRTERIYRVLGTGRKFSSSDMLALEMDIYSELDRFVAENLVHALDHAKNASKRAHKAADILRDWNGQMDANSSAPTIVSKARTELMRLLLEPKLGPAPAEGWESTLNWKSYHWMMETIWLENVLSHQPARWLPAGYSNFDALLVAALENTLKDAPANLESWKWGPENSVTIQNPVLGKIPILTRWTGPGTQPQWGSVYTVKAAGRDYGPSERFTADLSNLDLTTLNLVTGNAGNFLSPYYMDQWKAWYTGYTFVLPFSTAAVEKSAAHRVMLQPR
ncbi:MAG TPA: penicillin acylase family protein [Terriglobales bacterium]|nr:penicillin acylase family protein [Terriglobales bacterium]